MENSTKKPPALKMLKTQPIDVVEVTLGTEVAVNNDVVSAVVVGAFVEFTAAFA